MKKIKILNVQFDACSKDEALMRIFDVLERRAFESGKQIVTPNPEMLLESAKNSKFREALNKAWLSIPDGIGILWACAFQNSAKRNRNLFRFLKAIFFLICIVLFPGRLRKIFPERVTGVDLMESICALSVKRGKPEIFLLGAEAGVAQKVQKILEAKYPGIKIVGVFPGSPSEDDFLAIQAFVAETRPKILFVAYGAPKQEIWIAEHLSKIPSVKIAMGVGGAFDFIAGMQKRSPKWMQKLGLEWLYRLIQEPSRSKRIWNAVIRFPLAVIKS